jgi:hypothetical protein
VGWRAEDDKIAEPGVFKPHFAPNAILPHCVACGWDLEAQDIRESGSLVCSRFFAGEVPAAAVIKVIAFFLFRLEPLGFDFFFGAETLIYRAFVQEQRSPVPIKIKPLGLKIGSLIPGEAKPGHGFNDLACGFLCGTFHIRVFDAENKCSALASGIEPVEKGGTRPSDMEVTCGAGRKTNPDFIHGFFLERR